MSPALHVVVDKIWLPTYQFIVCATAIVQVNNNDNPTNNFFILSPFFYTFVILSKRSLHKNPIRFFGASRHGSSRSHTLPQDNTTLCVVLGSDFKALVPRLGRGEPLAVGRVGILIPECTLSGNF